MVFLAGLDQVDHNLVLLLNDGRLVWDQRALSLGDGEHQVLPVVASNLDLETPLQEPGLYLGVGDGPNPRQLQVHPRLLATYSTFFSSSKKAYLVMV